MLSPKVDWLAALLGCVLLLLTAPTHAEGEQKGKQVEDDPNLPRVLIIGDSISIGYTGPTRKLLEGTANLHRPNTNCGSTIKGLEKLDDWLGEEQWDVIHFNWGLHDLKYVDEDGEIVQDPADGKQVLTVEQYAENLDELVNRLKQTGATLIWRTTTPIPDGSKGRIRGDSVRYNAAAAEVIAKHEEVLVHDLYAYVKEHEDELAKPANVHYTRTGSRRLAEEVVKAIRVALEQRSQMDVALSGSHPNLILMMADDLGWGDTGYNGHEVLKTPHLDVMAKEGIRFNRFYAAAPVCSPTRGSCLTGRHPYRYGIPHANTGQMLPEELTLAELMSEVGYRTGHFGKWHLGTLTKIVKDGNRGGPKNPELYSPPWENGFQVCFSTESKVPTWNPMFYENGKPYGTHYWSGPDEIVKDNLEGDDSRVIMDRVVPFVEQAAKDDAPFFAVVWFHTPHLPVVAGPDYLEMYKDEPGQRPHYYGCITAMDEQVGRLREVLEQAGVADNTIIYFASDNGPEGGKESNSRPGSAGDLRGRKRSLYEGGIRVPGLMMWPARYDEPQVVDVPFNTSDYLPTVLDVLGIEKVDSRGPFDGVSMLPVLDGKQAERGEGMGFRSQSQTAWITDQYKLIRTKNNKPYQLYDLVADASEKDDLGQDHPAYASLKADLGRWLETLPDE